MPADVFSISAAADMHNHRHAMLTRLRRDARCRHALFFAALRVHASLMSFCLLHTPLADFSAADAAADAATLSFSMLYALPLPRAATRARDGADAQPLHAIIWLLKAL